MKSAYRDHRVEADLALLKQSRISFELDFVKLTCDPPSLPVPWKKRKNRQGARVTLQEARYVPLSELPADVLRQRLAAVEFTIDLRPRAVPPDVADHLQLLWRLQEMLFRRLAPWQAPLIGDRVYLMSSKRKTYRRLLASPGDALPRTYRGHTVAPVIARTDLVEREGHVKMPTVDSATGAISKETVYWGRQVQDDWGPPLAPVEPMAQVRLYIKVHDNRLALERSLWSCRLEVCLNGTALREQHNLHTVQDLLGRRVMRRVVADYLALVQPRPPELQVSRLDLQKKVGKNAAVTAAFGRRAKADFRTTVERGALAGSMQPVPPRMVSVPELTGALLAPASDFDKAARRGLAGKPAIARLGHRSLSKSVGQTT